ncbi:MAG: 16S rRNA (cytidine(1402)-2'-O)-methyltransferase [bacterium]
MKLTLIGTPLGNLDDLSLRSIKALFSLDVIIAEDTRMYIKLRNLIAERFPEILKSLNLPLEHRPELISYREQNHDRVFQNILKIILEGKSAGMITDAGLPTISDPGFRLVRDLVTENIEVDIIPGPTAIDSALAISALPTDRFAFIGFLPRERSKIYKIFEKFDLTEITVIYYESPFRILKTLEILKEKYPEIKVALINDLTKKFQKIIRGDISEAIEILIKQKVQGEWVVCVRISK